MPLCILIMELEELRHKVFWKYFFRKGRFINFKNPKFFSEKIQWLKVYDCIPIKTTLADKIKVRDWIKEKIGSEYLKEIYGIYENPMEIKSFGFPKREFVVKTNHGSKMQLLVIEGKILTNKHKEKFLEYLKTNYAYKSGYEMQYDKIKPVVFVEEYIKNTNELFEYLFFCFNGSPKMVLFSSNKRDKEIKSTMFDINWNNLHFNLGGKLHDETILPPKNFDKMIEIAKTLSKGFKFVRVDLHNVDGKIYFGEMTFTPNSGYMKFSNPKWDRIMGDMLNLDD